MKNANIVKIVAIASSLFLYACDSGTSPKTSNSGNNSSNTGNDVSTCALSSNLPKWSGSKNITWQEALGSGCFASPVKASVSEIKNYSALLADSSWTSDDGWVTTGSVSSATFQKNKNVDTAYQIVMTGTSADSLYEFTLNTVKITYKYALQRMFNALPIPTIKSTPAIKWTFDYYTGSSNYVNVSSSDINAFKSSLLANKWTLLPSEESNAEEYQITYVDPTSSFNGKKYAISIEKLSGQPDTYFFIFE